jgi:hypothetical protein
VEAAVSKSTSTAECLDLFSKHPFASIPVSAALQAASSKNTIFSLTISNITLLLNWDSAHHGEVVAVPR